VKSCGPVPVRWYTTHLTYYSFLIVLSASETKIPTNFRSYNFGTQPQIYPTEISCILLWSEVHSWSWVRGLRAKRLSGLRYSLISSIKRGDGTRSMGLPNCYAAPGYLCVINELKCNIVYMWSCAFWSTADLFSVLLTLLVLMFIYYTPDFSKLVRLWMELFRTCVFPCFH
jgi:hypothetical protein